jgi:molecular chaperone GrpE
MSDVAPEPQAGQPEATDATAETSTAEATESATSVESALSEARDRVADLEDQRLRALADLDNLRKRCTAQAARAASQAGTAVAAQWLPVVDNLDRALSHSQSEPDAVMAGVLAIRDQAIEVLTRLGFARQEAIGEAFDPTRHEAVATRPDPQAQAGTVVEVLQAGYGEGDHQLRPAQVVVAQEPQEPAERGQHAGAG